MTMGVPNQWCVSRAPDCTPVPTVACFHLALWVCFWLTCITGFGDLFWLFLSTDSPEDNIHPRSAAPRESVSCFIVPSHLHKQCAGNATAQWGTGGKRECAMGLGDGGEAAAGQHFAMVCGRRLMEECKAPRSSASLLLHRPELLQEQTLETNTHIQSGTEKKQSSQTPTHKVTHKNKTILFSQCS